MEALERSGKNPDDAIESALRELGLERSDVEIEVLQEGKSGILGWGGEEAKVRVTPIQSLRADTDEGDAVASNDSELAQTAQKVVQELLSLMDIEASVETAETSDDQSPLKISIDDGDLGILIGRRGQSLAALQYVVNFIVSRRLDGNARVMVDVAGYRKRRQEELESLALRVADMVRSSHKAMTLESMPALERRIIHIALRDEPEISTGSVGFGDARKVVVSPL